MAPLNDDLEDEHQVKLSNPINNSHDNKIESKVNTVEQPLLDSNVEIKDGSLVVKVVSISNRDLNPYKKQPSSVKCLLRTRIPTENNKCFYLMMYESTTDKKEHLVLTYGQPILSKTLDMSEEYLDSERKLRGIISISESIIEREAYQDQSTNYLSNDKIAQKKHSLDNKSCLLRIHSSCFTGECLGSTRCDCREQLQEAMHLMSEENSGVIIYLNQEGRGIGLKEKLLAYNLIDMGHDTVTANLALNRKPDLRNYQVAIDILNDLDICDVRLLTNNPQKVSALTDSNIMVERVPMIPRSWREESSVDSKTVVSKTSSPKSYHHTNTSAQCELDTYLVSKIRRMGHSLEIPDHVLKRMKRNDD